jgi:D-sedoheptulose 7-phosphate isomerase
MFEAIKRSYLDSLATFVDVCSNEAGIEKTVAVASKIANAFIGQNKVLIAGNGGSACDAMHFAEEFTGRFRQDRRPLPVIALTDPAHLTAVGNDFGFDQVFARAIEAHGKPGDVLLLISTSGNSENIVKAAAKGKELGLTTVALLGRDGGRLKGVCDVEFIVPGNTPDKIQEAHMMILHIIIEAMERILFPDNYLN